MKKLLCILMAILLCVGFVACGETSNESNPSQSDNSSSNNPSSSTPSGDDNTVAETKDMEMLFEDYYDFAQEGATDVTSADTKKVKVSGTEIRAQGITEQPVDVTVEYEDGSKKLYKVTVKKTKINIVIVAGQSNAVGELSGTPAAANKYLSSKCVKGSAFLWTSKFKIPLVLNGNGERDGFRAGLAAEWYELSKLAGDIEKTVIIWDENHTATSAETIGEFFMDTERATVDKMAKLVNACYDYYKNGKGSEGFEIANCGLYWMQGESDIGMQESAYTKQFNKLWTQLNEKTNNCVKYCAFMRIRGNAGSLKAEGPVLSQQKLADENANMYMGSVITEKWNKSGKTETKVDISKYHIFGEEQYKDIVSNGVLTELQENIYGGLHYTRLGFNILGADAAYNMYPLLHKK